MRNDRAWLPFQKYVYQVSIKNIFPGWVTEIQFLPVNTKDDVGGSIPADPGSERSVIWVTCVAVDTTDNLDWRPSRLCLACIKGSCLDKIDIIF